MGFPSQVNVQAAPAVLGDWCDRNPRATVDAGAGAFVAGTGGVLVGRFAWLNADGVSVNNSGVGAPAGFIHREQQSLITTYLADNTMAIPQGMGVTIHQAGGIWVYNAGATTSAIGQTAYANNANGSVSFGTTAPTSASVTGSIAVNAGSASTIAVNSVTGSISGTTLTVTAVGTGGIAVGQFLSGGSAGTGYVNGATQVVAQLSGTAGGVGTYQVSVVQTVTSTTITASGGWLTVGGTVTGTFAVGQTLTGTGVTAGTTITALGSGTGGAGTYAVSVSQTTSSTAITASGGTLTVTAVGSGTLYVNDAISGTNVTAGTSITSFVSGSNGGVGVYLVNVSQTAASGTITVAAGTATKWVAQSVGAPGELVKMTTWILG